MSYVAKVPIKKKKKLSDTFKSLSITLHNKKKNTIREKKLTVNKTCLKIESEYKIII